MIMEEKHTYRVAGFRFEVRGPMPASSNLDPFLSAPEEEGEGELLFTLEMVPALPLLPVTPVYTTEDGPGFPEIAIGKYPDSAFRFCVRALPGLPVSGEMKVSPDFRCAQLHLTSQGDRHFALNNALMLLFAFASAHKGLLEMHSSVVMNGGKGYLFLGKSGTGKSTHSSLWLKHIPGTELLNDDNPILRLMPDGTARVYGSPWSGKTPCYKAQDVPVGAVVRIQQAPFNRITRLGTLQAYASLMASASGFRPFRELADGWHRTLEALAASVPCYTLECLPDEAAATLCHNTVTNG